MKRVLTSSSWVTLIVLLFILILGFTLRIGAAERTVVIKPLRADAGNYFMYAYNLRYKHTYSKEIGNMRDLSSPVTPDSVRSPGYPLFLTPFLHGTSFQSFVHRVVTAQVILSTLTILLMYLLCKSFLPSAWALAAALLVAISPHLIIPNSFVITETLFCFLLLVIGYGVTLFASKPSAIPALLTGVLIGLASLVRPILEYLPFLLGFWLLVQYRRQGGLRYGGALLFGFFLAFLPWILRNAITLGTFSDDTLLINFFHHGLYPDFTFEGVPESRGYPYHFDPRSPDISKDLASVLSEILRRLQDRPWEHVSWFLLEKPVFFWSWDDVQGAGGAFVYPVARSPYFSEALFRWSDLLMFVIHWPVIILGGLGSLTVWLPSAERTCSQRCLFITRFLSLVLVSYTVLHMVGAPIQRYSFPLRPYLYSMTVFLAYFLWRTTRAKLLSSKTSKPPSDLGNPCDHTPSFPPKI
jgi:4-amino-4-deoxy-L-arabinose transferase-like glycosyltransferase